MRDCCYFVIRESGDVYVHVCRGVMCVIFMCVCVCVGNEGTSRDGAPVAKEQGDTSNPQTVYVIPICMYIHEDDKYNIHGCV